MSQSAARQKRRTAVKAEAKKEQAVPPQGEAMPLDQALKIMRNRIINSVSDTISDYERIINMQISEIEFLKEKLKAKEK